jgi:hypothetical protein
MSRSARDRSDKNGPNDSSVSLLETSNLLRYSTIIVWRLKALVIKITTRYSTYAGRNIRTDSIDIRSLCLLSDAY